MPIYEYACPSCKAEFEVLIRKDADIPANCPKCKKGKPVKQFSSFAALSSSGSAPSCAEACPSGSACAAAGGGCAGGGCMLDA